MIKYCNVKFFEAGIVAPVKMFVHGDNMMSALTQFKSLLWYCTVCEPTFQSKLYPNPTTTTFQEEIKTCIIST